MDAPNLNLNAVKFVKLDGSEDIPLRPIPPGVEYPHQLDPLSSADDGPVTRQEFQSLLARVIMLELVAKRLAPDAAYLLGETGDLGAGDRSLSGVLGLRVPDGERITLESYRDGTRDGV